MSAVQSEAVQNEVSNLEALLARVQHNRTLPRGAPTVSVRPPSAVPTEDSLELDITEELASAPPGPATEPIPRPRSSRPPVALEFEPFEAAPARRQSISPAPIQSADDEPLTRETPIQTALHREATRISAPPPRRDPLPESIAATPPFASDAIATFVESPASTPPTFGDLLRRSRALRVTRRPT